MSQIQTGDSDFGYYPTPTTQDDPALPAHVFIHDAPPQAVGIVLAANNDDNDIEGRSQWVFMRFPNGDLFLAVAPQGDTYFDLEQYFE